MQTATTSLLRTAGLTKRYGRATVLDRVSLEVRAGEIHALLGANGAGKSTLCKIVSGLIPPSDGSMSLAGEAFVPTGKAAAEAAGVEIVQQELNLIPTLSVAENLFFSRMPSRAGVIRRGELHRNARRTLDRFGLSNVDTHALVGSLGVGAQQMVEIAKTLARDCRLLILDEPTAALSGSESERLFEQLRRLRADGIGMIYISHRLGEVKELSDRYSVLRDGARVGTYDTGGATTDTMVDQMAGQAASARATTHRSHRTPAVAMRVRSVSTPVLRDVSFDAYAGERLGVTGLVGAGRTELLRAVFGADEMEAGSVQVGEQGPTRFRSPHDAVAAGLAMVTEDRKENGLLLSQPVRVNTTLGSLWRDFSTASVLRSRREREATGRQVERLETRCESIEQPVGSLSGGNQQKVAISKWLVRDASVFLFDEPTRGIDVRARRRIYALLDALAAEGKACVIVSSDLEELLETCDRILVMSNGRITTDVGRDDFDRDAIMRASFAGYAASGPPSGETA